MTTIRTFGWPPCLWMGLVTCLIGWTGIDARAADLKLKAQLIWGTDEDKPKKPHVAELDPKLRDKLKLFKWRNYFEIKDPRYLEQQDFGVPPFGSKRVKISDLCEIEVKHLGGANIEVKLIGEGRLVQSVKNSLPKGEYLFLAGNVKEKNTDAWIVALSMANP